MMLLERISSQPKQMMEIIEEKKMKISQSM